MEMLRVDDAVHPIVKRKASYLTNQVLPIGIDELIAILVWIDRRRHSGRHRMKIAQRLGDRLQSEHAFERQGGVDRPGHRPLGDEHTMSSHDDYWFVAERCRHGIALLGPYDQLSGVVEVGQTVVEEHRIV